MSDLDFSVYAMKLQPGGAEESTNPYEFCRNEGVIGVGWKPGDETYETVDEVHQAFKRRMDRRSEDEFNTEEILSDGRMNAALRYIFKEMDIGDYVWVNEGNEFALCRVDGTWEVASNLSDDRRERYQRRDVQNFRPVDWVDVPYSLIPGFVRRRFSLPFGTATEMDQGINEDSKQILHSLHSQKDFDSDNTLDQETISEKIEQAETDQIFNILGPRETQEIVFNYLQAKGWRIDFSSTGDSQATIECEMRREKGGDSVLGYLQVKTGAASVDPENYTRYADAGQMIFFVQSGVDVKDQENMSSIRPETIHEYIVSDINFLPSEPLLKLDFALE
jgi:hypothetical protein